MMLIVSYNLKGPSNSYVKFYEVLKSQPKWWHYLTDTWLIITSKTPDQLIQDLQPYYKDGDRVLIAKINPSPRPNGWMPKDAWDWINTNSSS